MYTYMCDWEREKERERERERERKMKLTVVSCVFLTLFTTWSSSLDYNWVTSIDGTNCTSYLTNDGHNRIFGSTDRLFSTSNDTVLCPQNTL